MKSFTKRATLVSAATILLGIIPLHAMDEITTGDPASQEIAPQRRFYPKSSNNTMSQPQEFRQRSRGRHGTGSRKMQKQNLYEGQRHNLYERQDKFGSEEYNSASESPEGTSEGESN